MNIYTHIYTNVYKSLSLSLFLSLSLSLCIYIYTCPPLGRIRRQPGRSARARCRAPVEVHPTRWGILNPQPEFYTLRHPEPAT